MRVDIKWNMDVKELLPACPTGLRAEESLKPTSR